MANSWVPVPLSGMQATGLGLLTVVIGSAVAGASVFATIVWFSDDLLGSALFGLGIFGFAAMMAAATAVASQLFGVRRRVAAVGAGFLGVAFVVRMIANSNDDRLWMNWLSVFGWMDRLRPFGDNNFGVVAVYLGAVGVLMALAMFLRSRRDMGSGSTDTRRRTSFSTGPAAVADPFRVAPDLGNAAGLGAGARCLLLLHGQLDQSDGRRAGQRPCLRHVPGDARAQLVKTSLRE